MNKSNLMLALVCLTAVASLSRAATTQENEGTGTFDEPLANERQLPEPMDEGRLLEPDTDREFGRSDDFGDSRRSRDIRSNAPNSFPGTRVSVPQVMRPRQRSRTVIETFMEVVPPEEVVENRKLQAAIKSLKTSKSESEKKKAADIISAQLKLQFERDLKQREKELAKVEERVRSLREQLDKRKAAQDDIINLRLQTLVNDANGLGFPTNSFGGSTTGGSGFPGAAGLSPFAPEHYDDFGGPSFDPRRVPESGLYFDRTETVPEELVPRDTLRDPAEDRFFDDRSPSIPGSATPTPGLSRDR